MRGGRKKKKRRRQMIGTQPNTLGPRGLLRGPAIFKTLSEENI